MLKALGRATPLFLASVTSVDEALIAYAAGASIIDCKAPDQGALGALAPETVAAIVEALPDTAIVSATIGDLPSSPGVMVPAAESMAATGVQIVKAGFFGDGDARGAIRALGSAELRGARLYAVLMADRDPDFDLIGDLAAARFLGVMLDTADKSSGALSDVMALGRLQGFVEKARQAGLLAGLAGSLRQQHVAKLAAIGPDILGFRGALCRGGRTGALAADLVTAVANEIAAQRPHSKVTERSVA